MKLIVNNNHNTHVSNDTVKEFENTILTDEIRFSNVSRNPILLKFLFYAYYFCIKIGYLPPAKINQNHQKKWGNSDDHLFAVLMGFDVKKWLNGYSNSDFRSIYLFDALPGVHDKIVHFVRFFRINNAFISSSIATEILNKKLGFKQFHWIPEGINPQEYRYYTPEEKNIDVLAIGRKYDIYHNNIRQFLEDNNKTYLYEKTKGKLVFPTRTDFIEGMARSKISICVPSSITHPERSGNIETMTIRYLQSIVSKCLIVGHAPDEMVKLFGYNPVIEINHANPVEQIDYILKNYNAYLPLIEKNYQIVIQHHTWDNRWNQIKTIIGNNIN
ncbi:MAG: hypothetical protein HOO86_09585 [Bacteroidales bacterium]|nr:hypothetical protein [Bacteroidales bacterium]